MNSNSAYKLSRQLRLYTAPRAAVTALALLVSPGCQPALSYTKLCSENGVVTGASLTIHVSKEELEGFSEALKGFAQRNTLDILPNRPKKVGQIAVIVVQHSGEGIHISNEGEPENVKASISECGSEEWKPFWEKFTKFVREFEAQETGIRKN